MAACDNDPPHPEHRAVGATVIAATAGGLAGIAVVD
jgi:hypothetical protein